MASSKNHRRPKDHGTKPSATANGSAGGSGGGGGGGGSSVMTKTLTWIVVIALIGVSAALAVTCTQLNEQITKERKVHEEAVQKMEEDISAARAEVTVAATERLEALAQTSSLQRDLVAQKEECKSTLKTQLTEMEATNHRLRSELRDQEKATEDMKERAESLEEKLKANEEELTKTGEKMAQSEEELAGVSTKLQDTLVLVVEHEAKEKQLEDLVEELTLEGKQKDASVEKLEQSVNGLKQEYKSLDEDYADCIVAERVCQDSNKNFVAIAKEISANKERVDDLLLDTKTKLVDTEKILEESKQEVVAKSSLLEAAQSSLRAQEERITELVAAQSENENVKSDLAGKVARLEALSSNLEARLQASDQAYATEKGRLNEQLQKNLENLQQKDEALQKFQMVNRDKDTKILELQAQLVKAESKPKEQPAAPKKNQGR
ncbi:uncharacterized protein LOC143028366 isoform X4 [Oratosquilla oratoria]|uniref:uncharacterized protein LOC143028366 isoform X4 n=1 Tax=Oratosquilla oratoria TaxID=337810 RepID=UPI003F75AABF